ncbi:MAG: hypothetical protein Q9227_008556 [Pyrenula ochraceoflavens]
MADTLSIEEINKIRIAAGAKPLPVAQDEASGPSFKEQSSSEDSDDEPASTLATREAAAGENWQKIQDEAAAKKQREEKAERIRKARDQAQKHARLKGKGLGDESDQDDLGTKAWLKNQKKRQKQVEKERARKMEEDLAERERLAQIQYGTEDLTGVKVGHEATAFEDIDGEQVLTLKDTMIDGEEGEEDELENVSLREREKLQEKLQLKKRKPVYDPTTTDDDGSRKILSQYDEEIEGKKRKRFTLGTVGAGEERGAKRQEIGERLRTQPMTLDILKETPQSDYLDISEIKMKKPKKNKKKPTRKKAEEDEDIFPTNGDDNGILQNENSMDIDSQAAKSGRNSKDAYADDEDLQASLAAQRNATLKKRKRRRPEDIARELREEALATPNEMDLDNGDEGEGEPGLVIDETSEFVANLQRPVIEEQKASRREIKPKEESPERLSNSPYRDQDVEMTNNTDTAELSQAESNKQLEREHSDANPEVPATGLEAEANVGQGLGSTLKLLRERGLIEAKDFGGPESSALQRERNEFLAVKHRVEAEADAFARQQRERDRASGRLDRMSVREREEYARSQNQQRDLRVQRDLAALFEKDYRPDVRLSYIDEHGRQMSQKEAFKELSHQFHGKGSGAGKTEKRLKKIEDEKRSQAKSVLDSSETGGYGNLQGTMTRRNRQAGVRLM